MSQDYLDKLIEKDKAGTQIQSIPLHDTELRGITIDDPITVEGNPINFSTKNEQNAIQTVVDINPIQDLHGYGKPWVGGAGKNILPTTVDDIKNANPSTAGTWNGNEFTSTKGTKFTLLTDSDNNVIGIKANGQNTSSSVLDFVVFGNSQGAAKPVDLIANNDILTGCPQNGSDSTYMIVCGGNSFRSGADYGAGGTLSNVNNNEFRCIIRIAGNYNPQNIIFYPMIRKSTVTDATFEPYENICPILPHEEIKIGGCGKNLLDSTTEKRTNPDTGATSDRYLFYDQYIPCKVGTYYFSCTTTLTTIYQANIALLDTNKNRIDVISLSYPKLAGFAINITNANTKYLKVTFYHSASISSYTFTNPQLEFGSEKTSYEPYKQSNSLTLPLPENVYGGTLNLETGELVVRYASVDLSNYTWTQLSGYNIVSTQDIPNIKYVTSNTEIGNGLSEKYQMHTGTGMSLAFGCIAIDVDKVSVNMNDSAYQASGQFCYELATPYTLQLTPTQLKLFKDVNNLNSSDYTTLTVTYHSNSMATLTPATDTTDGLLSAMDKHKLNTYDIADIGSDDGVTVEDNPLTITTRSDQHALSTKVSLAPIQDLHGYSKPWVGGAGKNKLPLTIDDIKLLNTIGTWNGNVYIPTGESNFKYTILVDSDNNIIGINVNGTPVKDAGLIFTNTLNGNEIAGYLLNGCPSGGSESSYYIRLQQNGGSWTDYAVDTGNGATISSSASSSERLLVCFIRVKAGTAVNNLIFYPMIRLSTEPIPTFEPYTNICSISGLDEIDILGCGKNIFDGTYQAAYVEGASIIYKYNADCRTAVVPIIGGKTYSVTRTGGNRFSIAEAWEFPVFNNAYTFLYAGPNDVSTKMTATVKTSKDTKYLLIYVSNAAVNAEVQVEESKEVTDYEPYKQSNNLSLPLPETVYGGELDLESGELRVTHNIVDLGSLSWSKSTATGHERFFANNLNNHKTNSYKLVSDRFEALDNYDILYNHVKDNVICMHPISASNVEIHNSNYESLYDVTGFKTFITGSKIAYELATPITINLTPEQLSLFKDINHISTNAKSISVTYREGKLAINSPATDTTDGLLSAIDKRALDRTEEIVEGNPIQFETESVQVAKSTIVDLEPIQDLHGYSKPWVGGAGKNLLDYSIVQRKSGCTYTINTDGSLTVVTDAYTNTNPQVVLTGLLSSGTYTFSNIEEISGYVMFAEGDYSHSVSVGGSYTFTYDGSSYLAILYNVQNHSTTRTYKGMIEEGSIATSYEPYENICPISGRSEVDILGCGKNLFDKSKAVENYRVITANGELEGIGAGWHASDYTGVENNTTYIMNFVYYSSANFGMAYYDKNKVYISGEKQRRQEGDTSFTFTTPNNCKYIRFSMNNITDIDDVQLEKGSIVTTYEPYQSSNSLQIQLGQTVYGGQLDVENGVLVVDRGIQNLGDLTWNERSTMTSGIYRMLSSGISSSVKSCPDGSVANIVCSCYTKTSATATYAKVHGISIDNAGSISIYDERYNTIDSPSAFKTAMNGQTLVYELATPTTISLTPEQVKLLQGVNTITTNADNITLTYRNGSVATLNDLESLYAKLKAYIDSLHAT